MSVMVYTLCICENEEPTREKPANRSFSNAAMRRDNEKFRNVTAFIASRACHTRVRIAVGPFLSAKWIPERVIRSTHEFVGSADDTLQIIVRG